MQLVSPSIFLRLGRVSNLPTVWTNTLAGVAVAGAPLDATLVPLCIGTSLFYIGGMYLNDAFDSAIDARERPERPIPSGQISRATVLALGFGMLAIGAMLCLWTGVTHTGTSLVALAASCLALAGAIVVYDINHKENPLSPLIMGLCRSLVYLVAAVSVGGQVGLPLGTTMLGTLAYLIGLTYVAKQENLNRIQNLWPLAFLGLPVVQVLLQMPSWSVLGVLLSFVLWTFYALSAVLNPERRSIPQAVTRFIAGIALLDAVWAMHAGESQLALLCALCFLATRATQRIIPGT